MRLSCKKSFGKCHFSAKAIQFWPASGLKGMPNTQIYDKEGQEKYLEKNPAEILARNRLFKPPEMGGEEARYPVLMLI